nr:hypothetical protein [uncultured Cellulosilyticum sp.]
MSKKNNDWIVKFDSIKKESKETKKPEKKAQKEKNTMIFINSKVKNLAYEKNVTLHYRDSISDTWKESEAKFDHVINEQEEIWSKAASFKGEYIEYAIKYEVGGNTYWDNNNGKNYKTYKDGRTI